MDKDYIQGYELSDQQRHLWALQKDGVYSAQCAVLIEGTLNAELLTASLLGLVDRHEILRTTFERLAGMTEPVQVIADAIRADLKEYDFSSIPAANRDAAVDALIDEGRLTQLEFIKVSLVKLAASRFLLIVSLPALCADASGLKNLIVELCALYGAGLARQQLQDAPLHYADIAQWQNELFESSEMEIGKDYWQSQDLTPVSAVILPFESQSADSRHLMTRSVRVELSLDEANQIDALATRYGTSTSVLLLTVWQVLLSRLTGEADVIAGYACDGRSYDEIANALGLLTRFVPVRCTVPEAISIEELVKKQDEAVEKASAWQQCFSWERLVGPHALDGFPYSFESVEWLDDCIGEELRLSIHRLYAPVDRFRLKPVCLRTSRGLTVEFHYDTDSFVESDVRRAARQYCALLTEILENPRARIDGLNMLTGAERQQLVVELNDTTVLSRRNDCVHQLFERCALSAADFVAVVFEDEHVSFGSLDERANQLWLHLASEGVGPESRVAICVEPSIDMVAALLGVLKAGAAYVPLDPGLPSARLEFLVKDSQPAAILTQSRFVERLPDDGCVVLCLDTVRVLRVGENSSNIANRTDAKNLAYIIYTSGSTGKPKGVAVEHRQLVNYIDAIVERIDLRPWWRFALVSTIAADLGNTVLFAPLCYGGTLHVISPERASDAASIAEYFDRNHIDCLKVVPSHLTALLDTSCPERVVPRSALILGGEASSWELIQRIRSLNPGCAVFNHYGPTETTVGVLTYDGTLEQPGSNGYGPPLGRPLLNIQAYVLNEGLEESPVWGLGELHIGGAGVARGYLGRPELTAEKFIPDHRASEAGSRQYKTGDLARHRPDGFIQYIGRDDDQVKIRGFRVQLKDIEANLKEHPSVRDVVVLAREDSWGDKNVAAYFISERGAQSEEIVELRRFLENKLPSYMIPACFVRVASFPLTANGKLDRNALPEPERIWSGPKNIDSPTTQTQELLAAIWTDVLGVENVGLHDNFFDLGGHSLVAMRLISRIRMMFQAEVSLDAVFDRPTVAELAIEVEQEIRGRRQMKLPPIESIARTGQLPLSFAQQRLWFLDQLVPNNIAYNIPRALTVIGRVNLAGVEQSLDEVVRRHEVLRTTFPSLDGTPVQHLAEDLKLAPTIADLRELKEAERSEKIRHLVAAEAARPFSLAQGPLIRVSVVRSADEENVVLFTLHHIVSDRWSMGVLVRELSLLSEAFSEGRPSPLHELPVQYVDFAIWQRQCLQGSVLEEHLSYWKQRLTGAPVLQLPLDRPRPAITSNQGASLRIALPMETSSKLRALSRRAGVTMFMTLLAAFKTLLARYTSQEDIVVGTHVANRNCAEIEGLIGFFINVLALRADLSDDPRFENFLVSVRQITLEAYAHQDLPFDQLVGELDVERSLSHSPVFQVVFGMLNAPGSALKLSNLALSAFDVPNETAKSDLVLNTWDGEDGIGGTLEYNSEVFDRATMIRLMKHYRILLESIVARPGARLSQLDLISEAETHQLSVDWNDTEKDYLRAPLLHEMVGLQADRIPDATALSFEGQFLSYSALDRTANRVSSYLRGFGVGPEIIVGLCFQRSLDLIEAMIGVLKAGGAFLPLDPAYPTERLAYIIDDAGLPVLITQLALTPKLPSSWAQVICLDGDRAEIEGESDQRLDSGVTPGNLAYVIYTSGSTGKPKGVLLCHQGLRNLVHGQTEALDPSPGGRVLQFARATFDACVSELATSIFKGACLSLARQETLMPGNAIAATLEEEAVSLAILPPTILTTLPDLEFASLRTVVAAGEACPAIAARRWSAGRRLIDAYGPTEVTVCASTGEYIESSRPPAIGRPIPNTRVHVLNQRLNPVPIGVAGELYIAGDGLARGYLNSPASTAEKLIPNSFSHIPGQRLYRSGDLGRFLPDGRLDFLGRIDHQVKVRGFRIELGEIEAALNEHDAVIEAAVIARDADGERQGLVAYVLADERASITGDELRDYLRTKLPEYMLPGVFMVLNEMPLTPHGKIDRKALPSPHQERPQMKAGFVAPRSSLEKALADIWAEVLQVDRVGVYDNFFELGGDSILSVRVLAKANQLGFGLTTNELFQHQTIAALAAVTTGVEAADETPDAWTGPVSMTPIQHWFFESKSEDPHHYNQSLLLDLPLGLDAGLVEPAIDCLVSHHDSLRLRFQRDASGWSEICAEPAPLGPVPILDLSAIEQTERRRLLEGACSDLQGTLNLESGPLIRAAWFDLGVEMGQRLFLVVHHLVVDSFSWRVLLEDLQCVYEQMSAGGVVKLPRKTTSFQRWADHLSKYAQSGKLEDEMPYWLDDSRSQVRELPIDHRNGPNTEASRRSVTVTLEPDETRDLLQRLPEVYRTQINDPLLAAVSRTIAQWSGQRSLLIDLEGHGREAIVDGVDLSRTIGWFTTVFPVFFDPGVNPDPGAILKRIKEQLRAIPHRGIGYGVLRYLISNPEVAERLRKLPRAEVSFNYLGQFDEMIAGLSRFAAAKESGGPSRGAGSERRHLLEIKGAVVGGQLAVTWSYSENLHRSSTIETLAQDFVENLRELIAYCLSPGAGGYTASDFPIAGLGEPELETAFSRIEFEGIPDEARGRNVEDAYPLSPMQEMTLFHSLFSPAAGIYVSQTTCRLDRLDVAAFTTAWQQVIDRHAILRTAFAWKQLAKPVQVVGRRVAVPLEVRDWRHLPVEDQQQRLTAYLEEERERGFQLSLAPLMRLGLFRLADESYQFVWTHHHVLLDGWSAHRIFKEVSELYEGVCRGERVVLEPISPLRNYIAWLQRQDLAAAERYWRSSLSGFTNPTPIGIRAESTGFGPKRSFDELQIKLSHPLSAVLRSFCQLHGLTANTLCQGAWALVLSRYCGEEEVVFGSVVSGRPPDLAGVESIVGLLINTLPVRVRIDAGMSYVQWLEELQRQQAEMRMYEYSPLLQVQNWNDVAAGRPLFESILIFQNYPVDSIAVNGSRLEVSDYHSYERSSYPITIVIGGGDQWAIKIVYDTSLVAGGSSMMLEEFRSILSEIVASPYAKVSRGASLDLRTERPGKEPGVLVQDELEQFDFQI
jgi:amino acid adenylation domain-containing protein/non-ribosomal peptide synthase protein (TIGR01720 family)